MIMADIEPQSPVKSGYKSNGGRGHANRANFVINRKHSVKNPVASGGKPRLKPKPAVLARWNFTESEKEEESSHAGSSANVKAQARLFEARDHVNNNHRGAKPPISNKPKLLPKPMCSKPTTSSVCTNNLKNTNTVDSSSIAQKPVIKPVAKPRKISATIERDNSSSSASKSTVVEASKDLSKPLPKDNKRDGKLFPTKAIASDEKSMGISGGHELDKNPSGVKSKANIAPRKLRGTFLRGIETALQGDTKPLESLRRKSESGPDALQAVGIVRSRFSQEAEHDSDNKVNDNTQLIEEEDSGSDYDDVEILRDKNGDGDDNGWEDIASNTLTEPINIPRPVAPPRRQRNHSHSDKGVRRRKIHSKERFKSDPEVIRASQIYDDIDVHQPPDMSRNDGWETASSCSDDGYEQVDESLPQTHHARSSENISLPVAKSPSSTGLFDKVKQKMGKTVDKAKSKFFTSRQQSTFVDIVCHSPANSSSPAGSPKVQPKFISPPIPERGTNVDGQFTTKKNMKGSSSEPVLNMDVRVETRTRNRNANHRFSLTTKLSDGMPSYPAPPRPLSSFDSFESSAEEPLPPVPPRGASRVMDSTDVRLPGKNDDGQPLHLQESMARCQSLEDIDEAVSRCSQDKRVKGSDPTYNSQFQDFYVDVPSTDGPDLDVTYEDIDTKPRPTLRKQSTAESEAYIDWGEVASSNTLDRLTKDRADSNTSSSSEPNYLDFSEDISLERAVNRKKRFQSRFMKFEPLYQEYTKDVIARSSWERRGQDISFDTEDDQFYHELGNEVSDRESSVFEEKIEKSSSESSTTSPSSAGTGIRKEFFNKTGTGLRTMWSEMPEVRGSGILDSVTPQEKKVQEAMFEVITSEASYLKSLNVLVDNFMMSQEFSCEHSTKCVLDRRSKHFLFSNLLAVREVSERLLFDLEARWQESTSFMLENVCDIIEKHASDAFECYIKYCSNQVYQERTLNELMKNQEFQEARLMLEANPECQGLNMTSFLLLPMQRITRLPLLIDAICHRLDPEKELERHQSAMSALIVLKKIVKQCNDGAKQMEQTEEMCLIDRLLVFKEVKKIGLISANRHLVKRGELTRITNDLTGRRPFGKAKAAKQMVYLFLFTDLLLVTKKKSEEIYSVVDYAKRSSLLVEPINDVANEPRLKLGVPSKCDHLFILVLLENSDGKSVEFILSCESPSDRARWMEAVTPPVQENPDEKIYESWDCPQVQVIHPYTAQQPDELSLEESDVVNVLRKVGDGWYEGERIRDGQKGWFPVQYTVEIKNSHVRNRNLRQRYRLLAAASKAISDLPPSKPKHIGVY